MSGTARDRQTSRCGGRLDGKQAAAGRAEARMRRDVFGVLEKVTVRPDWTSQQDPAVHSSKTLT